MDPESINGLNLYAYCNNNPVMYSDPDGHLPLIILLLGGLIVTALIITEPTEEVARVKPNSEVIFGNIDVNGIEINHEEISFVSVEGNLVEERFYFDKNKEKYFYVSTFGTDFGIGYNLIKRRGNKNIGFSFFSFGIKVGNFYAGFNIGFCDFFQWGYEVSTK